MFLHNKQMMYTVRVGTPDAKFGNLLLEQFGGPNGELAAALRYFTQGWNDPHPGRRDMLLDIATEEMSHLEMVGQTISLLLADRVKLYLEEALSIAQDESWPVADAYSEVQKRVAAGDNIRRFINQSDTVHPSVYAYETMARVVVRAIDDARMIKEEAAH